MTKKYTLHTVIVAEKNKSGDVVNKTIPPGVVYDFGKDDIAYLEEHGAIRDPMKEEGSEKAGDAGPVADVEQTGGSANADVAAAGAGSGDGTGKSFAKAVGAAPVKPANLPDPDAL